MKKSRFTESQIVAILKKAEGFVDSFTARMRNGN